MEQGNPERESMEQENMEQENMEEENNVVVLLDEDGEELRFEHLDTFEFNGDAYVALIPAEDAESDESDTADVLLFKLVEDENGEDALCAIEDEAELDMAFEELKRRMEDEFDFE